jgi:hypothetical protein
VRVWFLCYYTGALILVFARRFVVEIVYKCLLAKYTIYLHDLPIIIAMSLESMKPA